MQLTEARQKVQSEAPQMRSGWWLVPSFVGGAVIWGLLVTALVG